MNLKRALLLGFAIFAIIGTIALFPVKQKRGLAATAPPYKSSDDSALRPTEPTELVTSARQLLQSEEPEKIVALNEQIELLSRENSSLLEEIGDLKQQLAEFEIQIESLRHLAVLEQDPLYEQFSEDERTKLAEVAARLDRLPILGESHLYLELTRSYDASLADWQQRYFRELPTGASLPSLPSSSLQEERGRLLQDRNDQLQVIFGPDGQKLIGG